MAASGDLEQQRFDYRHPWSTFANVVLLLLTVLTVVSMVAALVFGAVRFLPAPSGPEARYLQCEDYDAACVEGFPAWLNSPAPRELVNERAYQRIRGELERSMPHIRGGPEPQPASWDERANEFGVGVPRNEVGWVGAEGVLEPLPADWPTFQRKPYRRTEWGRWADARAEQLAAQETEAYFHALQNERVVHGDRYRAEWQKAVGVWRLRRTRAYAGVAAGALGGLGLLLSVCASFVWLVRRRWAPYAVVVTRHALVAEGRSVQLTELTDVELGALHRGLGSRGHRAVDGEQAVLDALHARRDAAARGARPSSEDEAALRRLMGVGAQRE